MLLDVKPKKRRLVLAADREQPQSPTSPTEIKTELRDAKAHARQLSGQHLPKKSLKNLHDDRGPHTPIPTPPPEQWHIKQEEEQPSLDCASRFLPLYTIQLVNDTNFYVVDLQLSLLLGISSFKQRYPSLVRRQISPKEKERLWSPLSSMLLDRMMTAEVRELEKSRFLETDIYFVRLDQVVSLVKRDYSHLSASLITIALDIGYSEDSTVKLPPKFAMKMQKCRMLKFNNA
jgi:hypothetical protein